MKNISSFGFVILALISFAFSQGCTAQSTKKTKIEIAKKVWKETVEKHNNNYSYVHTFSSAEGMFEVKYYIQVEKNKVVAVKSVSTYFDNKRPSQEKIYTAKEIVSAKFKTMEEILEFTEKEVLTKDKKEYEIYFSLDSNNFIKTTGFFHKMCADDCFEGYKISELKW